MSCHPAGEMPSDHRVPVGWVAGRSMTAGTPATAPPDADPARHQRQAAVASASAVIRSTARTWAATLGAPGSSPAKIAPPIV